MSQESYRGGVLQILLESGDGTQGLWHLPGQEMLTHKSE